MVGGSRVIAERIVMEIADVVVIGAFVSAVVVVVVYRSVAA